MSTFGDLEPADVFDADVTIAPEQVAYRLHRLRRAVDVLAGHADPGRFDDLSRRDRDAVLDAGLAIADYAALYGAAHPEIAAETVHNLVRFVGDLPVWDRLTESQRRIAVDLIGLIFDWLRREGPR